MSSRGTFRLNLGFEGRHQWMAGQPGLRDRAFTEPLNLPWVASTLNLNEKSLYNYGLAMVIMEGSA